MRKNRHVDTYTSTFGLWDVIGPAILALLCYFIVNLLFFVTAEPPK